MLKLDVGVDRYVTVTMVDNAYGKLTVARPSSDNRLHTVSIDLDKVQLAALIAGLQAMNKQLV